MWSNKLKISGFYLVLDLDWCGSCISSMSCFTCTIAQCTDLGQTFLVTYHKYTVAVSCCIPSLRDSITLFISCSNLCFKQLKSLSTFWHTHSCQKKLIHHTEKMHKGKISIICHSETHTCVIENKTTVGRGYLLQDSIKYKNMDSCKVHSRQHS